MSVAVATSADTPSAPTAREDNARGRGGHRGRGRGRPPRGTDASAVEQRPNSARRGGRRPQGDRGPKPPSEAAVANSNPSATMAASLEPQHPPPTHSDASTRGQPASQPGRGRGGPSRRSNFRGKLTDDAPPEPTPSVSLPQRDAPPHQRQRAPASLSSDADLLTRLTHGLSNPPYLDCLICFNAITPPQPVWSCSPSSDDPSSTSVHCWTTLHLKCAVAWARKSTSWDFLILTQCFDIPCHLQTSKRREKRSSREMKINPASGDAQAATKSGYCSPRHTSVSAVALTTRNLVASALHTGELCSIECLVSKMYLMLAY